MTNSCHTPRVSVIMVNWNVANLAIEAIESLYAQGGLAKDDIELFLVDNASSDTSIETFAEKIPQIPVIANSENIGFGRANNQVFDQCRGDYIFLLNPDTVVQDQALKKAVSLMDDNPKWGVIGLRLLNADGSFQRAGGGSFPQIKSLAWNYLWLNKLLPKKLSPPPLFLEDDPQGDIEIDWVSGAALLLKPQACNNELFDSHYWMYGEDIDLCNRVHTNGYKVIYTSSANITHFSSQSVKQQQDEDLLAAPIKGPRNFYQRKHGSSKLWLYDTILFIGYLLRFIIYRLLAILDTSSDYKILARMSLRHLKTTTQHFGSVK